MSHVLLHRPERREDLATVALGMRHGWSPECVVPGATLRKKVLSVRVSGNITRVLSTLRSRYALRRARNAGKTP